MADAVAPPSRRRRAVRAVRRLVAVLGLTYILVVVMLYFLESRLVFFPTTAAQFWTEKPDPLVQDLTAVSATGTRIHAWWLPPARPEAGAVLFAHGNGGNVASRGPFMLELHRALGGIGVLAFDYPGYGKSEGSPDEPGCVAAAEAYWHMLADDFKVPPGRIVLMGESLGGGVATDLAARHEARALILLKTFSSLPAVAKKLYPFLPTHSLMRIRFDNLAKIGRVKAPVFVAHGTADTLVPPDQAEVLFAAANGPKRLFWMEGQDHNDHPEPNFYAALAAFLGER